MAAPRTTDTRTEDEIIAAVTAGHVMAGMPPTDEDIAAVRRVIRGESTVEEELAQFRGTLRSGKNT